MPAGAVAGAAAPGTGTAPTVAMNPFWAASNWYFESNNQEISNGSRLLTTSPLAFSINLDTNGFLKDYRCVVRSSGAVGGTAHPDGSWNLFQNVSFGTPNGSQFFKPHSGTEYLYYQAYGRPWEGDPTQWFDYVSGINPAFTFKLAPELRYTAGTLPNMDARRPYQVQGNIGAISSVISGSNTTAPTVTFASGIDTWAQPDAKDLMKRDNQPAPGGTALQVQRQLAALTLNGASSTNTLDARSITGNLMRLMILEVRDSNGVRQDYLTDPIVWSIDNRTLANYTQADLFGQFQDFYGAPGLQVMARPTGVYVFPRFFNPGTLVGTGWLQTSGATKLQWQTTTLSTGTNLPGTVNILSEQVVPLPGLDYEYTNL
jgi:hypothetical protein